VRASLSLTHRCNLSCKYCYSGRRIKEDMPLSLAYKIVDFVFEITPKYQTIEFSFFGGEPLLCFETIKEITDYIRHKEFEEKRDVLLSVTSNGTLLSDSILDFFSKKNISLCLSLDGPDYVHNLNRIYKDGPGSFSDSFQGLKLAVKKLSYLQVNSVYCPETLGNLPETVSFLTDNGASIIHLNPNITAVWDEEAEASLKRVYMEVANLYIDCFRRGREIAINLIDSKIILFMKNGYGPGDRCGMGETEWGFAPSGNMYPCERLIGNDDNPELCLGNVQTGIDLFRQCSVQKLRGNSNKECQTCVRQKYCMNTCGCTNYLMTGKTNMASEMLCESEKAVIDAAQYVYLTLSNSENELFINHFMQYIQERRHFQLTGVNK
jgi:uncharacterized protein